MAAFRRHVQSGEFQQAYDMLDQILFASAEAEKEARFLLLEQRFLQLVHGGKTAHALRLLRTGLTPLGVHRCGGRARWRLMPLICRRMFVFLRSDRLHKLSSRALGGGGGGANSFSISNGTAKQVNGAANGTANSAANGATNGAANGAAIASNTSSSSNGHSSRNSDEPMAVDEAAPITDGEVAAPRPDSPVLAQAPADCLRLLDQLQPYVSTQVMMPPGRLTALLRQAMVLQRRDCLYHNVVKDTLTLLRDHHCTRDNIPRHTCRILVGHTDEVWRVAFSHSGHMLATGSK